MIVIKKWSVVKDINGEEYKLNFRAKVKPIYYLNSRLIFSLGILENNKENRFAANYSDIEFVGPGTIEEKKVVING